MALENMRRAITHLKNGRKPRGRHEKVASTAWHQAAVEAFPCRPPDLSAANTKLAIVLKYSAKVLDAAW